MNYTKTSWENLKKESSSGKYGMAQPDGLSTPPTAGGWAPQCSPDPRAGGWGPAEMKVEPELPRQVLHTGRKGVNVEAFRLRNQLLKHLRGHSLWLHDGPVGQCEDSRLHTRYLLVPAHTRGLKVTDLCHGRQEQQTSERSWRCTAAGAAPGPSTSLSRTSSQGAVRSVKETSDLSPAARP